jgi:hypothetical protein
LVSSLSKFLNLLKKDWASKGHFYLVQPKPDGLVLETRVFGFCDFNTTRGKTYPFTSHFFPTLKNTKRRALKIFGGDFLIPLWNPSIIGWIQLPKDR